MDLKLVENVSAEESEKEAEQEAEEQHGNPDGQHLDPPNMSKSNNIDKP